MHLPNLAQDTRLIPFLDRPNPIRGMALISHLGHHLVIPRRLLERSGLPHIMHQGFFNVDVLSHLHRRQGGDEVGVVRRGDQHRVDLTSHFIQHHPEIPKALGTGVFPETAGRAPIIDIAQGDDILASARTPVRRPPTPDPDGRHIDSAIGRSPRSGDIELREHRAGRHRGGRCPQEPTSGLRHG